MNVISDGREIQKYMSKPLSRSNYARLGKQTLPDHIMKKIERKANTARVASGQDTSNPMHQYLQNSNMTRSAQNTLIYEPYMNPLIDKQHLEFPADRMRQNQRFWDYFLHDPMLSMGIRLLVEFPLSNFTLSHPDPELEDLYNEVSEELDLFNLILNMGIQYYVIGESIPFGFVDNPANPKIWTDFILLNPDWAIIHRHPTARPRGHGSFGKYSILYAFYKDPSLRKIVEDGPSSKSTGDLYRQIPNDILLSVKNRTYMRLPDIQTGYFYRVGNYWSGRGESIVKSCVMPLMYRDKLREGQYVIVDRHITPTEFYMIGETNQPATVEELEAFDGAMQGIWNGANKALIWHHALRIQWEGATGRLLPLQPEFQYVEQQVLTALGLSRAFLYGEGPTYANASVALEVLVSRFITFRQQLEKLLLNQIFAPMCIWNGIYKETPDSVKEESKYKFMKRKRALDLPTIKWDKENLREDREKINMIAGFAERGVLPFEELWKQLNLDPKAMREKLKEQLTDLPGAANILKGSELGGGLPGEIAPPMMGGGMGAAPTPVGEPAFEGGIEEGGDLSEVIPPESHKEPSLPTSL